MKKRKTLFLILIILGIFSVPSFLNHVSWFITGEVESVVVRKQWDLVAINTALFLAFLIPLNLRKRVDWKSMGVYTAFIASLFIEMYGVPLTIYLSSIATSPSTSASHAQEVIFSFTIFGQGLAMTFWKIMGSIVSIVGMSIIIIGWVTLYKNRKEREVVTGGIYKYSRHPQYLGIILVAIGWFIHWPSLLTLTMLPVLIYFYYKLALEEEKEVIKELENPKKYKEYRKSTPRFI